MSEPAPPFLRALLLVREERSDPGIVGIAEIEGLVLRFNRGIKRSGGYQAVIYIARNRNTGRLQRARALPTELPGEKMVAKRLLVIAAVGSKLKEHFALENCRDVLERSADGCKFRPSSQGEDESGEFAEEMVVGGGAEGFVAPAVPGVRWEDFLAEFVEGFVGDASSGEECIDPGEVDETHADFQSAGPIEAGEGRIVFMPIVEPLDAFVAGARVVEKPGGHGEADELVPAARFPNDFDVGAARLRAVVALESGFGAAEVFADEVITMPVRWVVYFERQMSEGEPVAAENGVSTFAQAIEKFTGSFGTVGQLWEKIGRLEGNGKLWRAFRIGALIRLLLHAQYHLARTHHPKAMPVPAELGEFGRHD